MRNKIIYQTLICLLFIAYTLPAQVIDFEDVDPHQPYITKAEDENVHPTFFLSNYDLSFWHWHDNTTPWLMEYVFVGGDMVGFRTNNSDPYQSSNGLCLNVTDTDDHPVNGDRDLGCWMITDEGPDWEAIPYVIEVRFQSLSSNPCYEVSGLLVDIDGNEAWRMDVYDQAEYTPDGDLGNLGTPSYSTYLVSDTWGYGGACSGCATINSNDIYNKTTSGSYLAGDGVPTYWHAKIGSPIQSVIFTYVGHQNKNARFAFDNIKLRQDASEECSVEAGFFSNVINNKGTFIATPDNIVGSTVVGYNWEIEGRKFTDKVINYNFKRKGTIPVCLTVTAINDESGECCTSTYCENIVIDNDADPCVLEPSFSYQCYTDDCIYKFSGKEGGSNTNITAWYWEFSDGSKYYTQDVLKTFSAPGVYDICLTVVGETNEEGECCTEKFCRTIDFSNCNGIPFIEDCDNGNGHTPAFKTQSPIDINTIKDRVQHNRTGVNIPEVINFELYPNPAKDEVSFELSLDEPLENVTVDLINISGQRINLSSDLKTGAEQQVHTLSLQDLSPGMYTMEIHYQGTRIAAEKLVVE